MRNSLKGRYFIKVLSNIITGIINAIMIAIVPKALGPVVYGQFIYIQQFFTQIIALLDAGSSIAFFTKLSATPKRKELITFYALYSFFIISIMLMFFYLIDTLGYTNLVLPDINNEYIFFGVLFSFLTWGTQIFIQISDAFLLTVSVEFIKIIHKVLSLFLLLYFVSFLAFDLSTYFYFHYISLLSLLGVLSYIFIKNNIFSKQLLDLNINIKKLTIEFVSYCSPLLIYSIVSLFVGLFDIWLLQKISGSIQTGYYGLAYSITGMCFLFTSAMTQIITREFSTSYAQNDLERIRELFKKSIPLLYSIAGYFGIFISFQSENVLAIFTDGQYKDVYWVLVVMAFYPLHQTYGQLSGSIFYATGQTKLYRNTGIVSILIGSIITLVLVYIYELGALGLAIKLLITAIISVNIQLYFNCKFLKISITPFLKHQFYSVVFFVILAFISTIPIFSIDKPLLNFIVSGIFYTLLVIIGGFIFPTIFATTRSEIRALFFRNKRL